MIDSSKKLIREQFQMFSIKQIIYYQYLLRLSKLIRDGSQGSRPLGKVRMEFKKRDVVQTTFSKFHKANFYSAIA